MASWETFWWMLSWQASLPAHSGAYWPPVHVMLLTSLLIYLH
jgi:hypothetical protein